MPDDSTANAIGLIIQLGIFTVLIALGLILGRRTEKRHFESLAKRERELKGFLVSDLKGFPGEVLPEKGSSMVFAEAVIATDYLKTFLAKIKKILGGELKSYESLMERARREAMVRMLQEAKFLRHNAVCNVRMDTADIGAGSTQKGTAMVVVMVSGTAYSVRSR